MVAGREKTTQKTDSNSSSSCTALPREGPPQRSCSREVNWHRNYWDGQRSRARAPAAQQPPAHSPDHPKEGEGEPQPHIKLHRGQAGTDQVPRSVPAPKTSTGHREAAPAALNRHTKPFLGCHTLQSPHCCCHRVPGTPAWQGPTWMAFLGEKKAFLVWRAPQRLTSLCSASFASLSSFWPLSSSSSHFSSLWAGLGQLCSHQALG